MTAHQLALEPATTRNCGRTPSPADPPAHDGHNLRVHPLPAPGGRAHLLPVHPRALRGDGRRRRSSAVSARTATAYDQITEKDWQAQVVELLQYRGYVVYHTFDSRRSQPGFPDLLALNPKTGDALVAELKSERGITTPRQLEWLTFFELCGTTGYVWRPSQIDEVIARVDTKTKVRP